MSLDTFVIKRLNIEHDLKKSNYSQSKPSHLVSISEFQYAQISIIKRCKRRLITSIILDCLSLKSVSKVKSLQKIEIAKTGC